MARVKRVLRIVCSLVVGSVLVLVLLTAAPPSVARERIARDVDHLQDITMDTYNIQADMADRDIWAIVSNSGLNETRLSARNVTAAKTTPHPQTQHNAHFQLLDYASHKSVPNSDIVIQTQDVKLTSPLDSAIVANATVLNQYMSLNLHSELRQKIAYVLSKHSCPEYETNNTGFPPVTFVCRNTQDKPALVTLFTTMYNNREKLIAFNNTLHLWASMRTAGLQSVLYVTPNLTRFENNTFYLMERACALGWDVAIAPSCNNESYPLIGSMFLTGYSLWRSVWYGYVNGDIVFDRSLFDALLLMRRYSSQLQLYTLLVGRRHDVKIEPMTSIERVKRDFVRSEIHADYGVDYFLTPRHGFPWQRLPPLVIGRPEVDNYILWLARNDGNITDIDCTDAILALHQGMDGWKKISRPTDHNRHVIKAQEIAQNVTHRYIRMQGRTECMTYKLGHNRSPYMHLYRRTVYLRGRDKVKCKNTCCVKTYHIINKDPHMPHVDFSSLSKL